MGPSVLRLTPLGPDGQPSGPTIETTGYVNLNAPPTGKTTADVVAWDDPDGSGAVDVGSDEWLPFPLVQRSYTITGTTIWPERHTRNGRRTQRRLWSLLFGVSYTRQRINARQASRGRASRNGRRRPPAR